MNKQYRANEIEPQIAQTRQDLGQASVHSASWPEPDPALEDENAARFGETLVAIASSVRRYKSEANIGLAAGLDRVQLNTPDERLAARLQTAEADLISVTRARAIEIVDNLAPEIKELPIPGDRIRVGVG